MATGITKSQERDDSLGAYIKARRELLKMTKVDAAELARVSRRTWNEVEAGTRTNVTAETLQRMSRALGLDPDALYLLSARSRFDRIEQLRRAAAYLFRTMTTTDFSTFLADHPDLDRDIAKLVDETERIGRDLDRAAGARRRRPGPRAGGPEVAAS